MKRLLIISLGAFGALVVLLIILGIIWINHPIHLTVENNSSIELEEVFVTVGPHSLEFDSIESGEKEDKWFFYKGNDSNFKITAKGHTFNDEIGYVTHGPLGPESVFIGINNNGEINFEQK